MTSEAGSARDLRRIAAFRPDIGPGVPQSRRRRQRRLRRLLAAIAAGGVDLVLIDTRPNGHPGVRAIVAACRRRRVRYVYR